jgi:hypothetical protein
MHGQTAPVAWLVLACVLAAGAPACNPFQPTGQAEGEACTVDADCVADLRCSQGVCTKDPPVTDKDLDGHDSVRYGGDDCDDDNRLVHPGADETCDGLDNDCDGQTDEELADRDCSRENQFGACAGTERCDARIGDWVDCSAAVPAAEACDGLDNDCDGQTDEDVGTQACPLTDGVCAGAVQSCLGAAGWSQCAYGPDYEPDAETRCDRLDNDCDGITDEDMLRLEPELGPEAADGIDNNCNGLTDEPGGVLVPIRNRPGTWIGAYEISLWENPDCSGTRYGEGVDDYPAGWPADASEPTEVLYACSLEGVIPSGHLSWYRARRACESQGMRLCERFEFSSACAQDFAAFPYGPTYVPDACNYPTGQPGQPGQPMPTGSFPGCTAYGLTFDMSGNMAEWTSEWFADQPFPGLALLANWGYSCEFCTYGHGCRTCDLSTQVEQDRLRRMTSCSIGDDIESAYPRDLVDRIEPDPLGPLDRPDFGARCCYDGP